MKKMINSPPFHIHNSRFFYLKTIKLLPATLEVNAGSLAASLAVGVLASSSEGKTVPLILTVAAALLLLFIEDAAEAPVAAGLGADGGCCDCYDVSVLWLWRLGHEA
jgi:hypothetical protein